MNFQSEKQIQYNVSTPNKTNHKPVIIMPNDQHTEQENKDISYYPQQVYYYEPTVQEIYVNVKQFEAIRKRKLRRDYLDSLMEKQMFSYLHESRHRHAMNRLRAPSGRFLTKEEMAKLKSEEEREE